MSPGVINLRARYAIKINNLLLNCLYAIISSDYVKPNRLSFDDERYIGKQMRSRNDIRQLITSRSLKFVVRASNRIAVLISRNLRLFLNIHVNRESRW